MRVSSSSGGFRAFENVAFGEVWLCGGQSNMQFSVSGVFDAAAEIADSANYPGLRLATVKLNSAAAPAEDVAPYATSFPYDASVWAVSQPAAFYPSTAATPVPGDPYGGGVELGWFSATCYFFGRRLYRHFEGGRARGPRRRELGRTVHRDVHVPGRARGRVVRLRRRRGSVGGRERGGGGGSAGGGGGSARGGGGSAGGSGGGCAGFAPEEFAAAPGPEPSDDDAVARSPARRSPRSARRGPRTGRRLGTWTST